MVMPQFTLIHWYWSLEVSIIGMMSLKRHIHLAHARNTVSKKINGHLLHLCIKKELTSQLVELKKNSSMYLEASKTMKQQVPLNFTI
jgi:hypothetical protein